MTTVIPLSMATLIGLSLALSFRSSSHSSRVHAASSVATVHGVEHIERASTSLLFSLLYDDVYGPFDVVEYTEVFSSSTTYNPFKMYTNWMNSSLTSFYKKRATVFHAYSHYADHELFSSITDHLTVSMAAIPSTLTVVYDVSSIMFCANMRA